MAKLIMLRHKVRVLPPSAARAHTLISTPCPFFFVLYSPTSSIRTAAANAVQAHPQAHLRASSNPNSRARSTPSRRSASRPANDPSRGPASPKTLGSSTADTLRPGRSTSQLAPAIAARACFPVSYISSCPAFWTFSPAVLYRLDETTPRDEFFYRKCPREIPLKPGYHLPDRPTHSPEGLLEARPPQGPHLPSPNPYLPAPSHAHLLTSTSLLRPHERLLLDIYHPARRPIYAVFSTLLIYSYTLPTIFFCPSYPPSCCIRYLFPSGALPLLR